MQGIKRKIVYLSLYEGIAILVTSTALAGFSDRPVTQASFAAVSASVIALLWNFAYNSAFEFWESRQARKGRSLLRRAVHAVGFELGLVVLLVPVFAAILGITLWAAVVYDIGLVVFFLVYTFSFNWAFDRIFGLPASAMPG